MFSFTISNIPSVNAIGYDVRTNSYNREFQLIAKTIREVSGYLISCVTDRTTKNLFLMVSSDDGLNWVQKGTINVYAESWSFDCDAFGNAYIIYTTASAANVIFYKFTRSGSTWTASNPETVATTGTGDFPQKRGGSIDIIVSPDGQCWVSWEAYYAAAAGTRNRNALGTWQTTPVKVADYGSNIDLVPVIIGNFESGNVIYVYMRSGTGTGNIYKSTDNGTSYSSAVALGANIMHGAANSVKASWVYVSSGNIYVKLLNATGTGYDLLTVDNTGGNTNPCIAINGNTIHVFYTKSNDIVYKTSIDLGNTWSNIIYISQNDGINDDYAIVDYASSNPVITYEASTAVVCIPSLILKTVTFYYTSNGKMLKNTVVNGVFVENGSTINIYYNLLWVIAIADSNKSFVNLKIINETDTYYITTNPYFSIIRVNTTIWANFGLGYDAGWIAGNTSGYNAGWIAGNISGYNTGWTAGNITGYNAGWIIGNITGYNAGWITGNATGYVQGFNDGYASVPPSTPDYNLLWIIVTVMLLVGATIFVFVVKYH